MDLKRTASQLISMVTISCGHIKFDIVEKYGEKTSTEKVITADKLSQRHLSQDKLSQVHLHQDKDSNAIISNEPVVDVTKCLKSLVTIPKGIGAVIDTYKHDEEYAIDATDSTKCIQPPKCISIQPPQLPKCIQWQVRYCKGSNNSNNHQPHATTRDICE